jgi:uncharacterized protein (AIM24 family)
VSATDTTYTCPYCKQTSSGAEKSCPTCGAPVDIKLRTTASGWTQLPSIANMARIQFGGSTCQVEGTLSPVAEMALAAGSGVYFAHDVLLWAEPALSMDAMNLSKPWTRHRSGLPLVMMEAKGPGRLALSHDDPGELIALPLQAGAGVDVREGTLLAATSAVGYDWFQTGVYFVATEQQKEDEAGGMKMLKMGLELSGAVSGDRHERRDDQPTWHYPVGQFMDRFHTGDQPGLVLVQAGGNAYVRELAQGESMLIKPPSLLFKDPTVGMQLHVEYPAAGMKLWRSWGNRYLWLRVYGPGRVGVQSCYERLEDPGTDFRDLSPHTDQIWR